MSAKDVSRANGKRAPIITTDEEEGKRLQEPFALEGGLVVFPLNGCKTTRDLTEQMPTLAAQMHCRVWGPQDEGKLPELAKRMPSEFAGFYVVLAGGTRPVMFARCVDCRQYQAPRIEEREYALRQGKGKRAQWITRTTRKVVAPATFTSPKMFEVSAEQDVLQPSVVIFEPVANT